MARPPETTAVAKHPQRAQIEVELAMPGANHADIARRYGLTSREVRWHRKRLETDAPAVFTAHRAAAFGVVDDRALEDLRKKLGREILLHLQERYVLARHSEDEARTKGDSQGATRWANVANARLEMIGKIVGELGRHTVNIQQNIVVSPEWLRLRGAITSALARFPEARAAVLNAVQTIEGEAVAIPSSDPPDSEHNTEATTPRATEPAELFT